MTFVERVGGSIVAPRSILRHVAEGGRGGFRDALVLLGCGIVAFELPMLVQAAWTLISLDPVTGLLLLLQPVSTAMTDLIVIVVASWIITLAAGKARRNTTRDLSLAALAWIPSFISRIGSALLHALQTSAFSQPLEIGGWSFSAALVALAIRMLRT